MPVYDSDPERRNVVLASLAFIAYFYAGGSFPETNIRLQIINAHFSKPVVLALLAWMIFIWFIYRYWVTHRGKASDAFKTEFDSYHMSKPIDDYLTQHFDKEIMTGESVHEYIATRLFWERRVATIKCRYTPIERNKSGKIVRRGGTYEVSDEHPEKDIRLTSFRGWLLAIWITLQSVFSKPEFLSFFVPYVLIVLAIAGAFKGLLF